MISLNLYQIVKDKYYNFIADEKKSLERLHNFAIFAQPEIGRIGAWIMVSDFWAQTPDPWVYIVYFLRNLIV